jgi:selenocysteine-specific elongation factor
MRVVATAGHVDHGKSTLVLALTGTDPDRFAEEKARGLTIDLGFAFATPAPGIEIGFVDVPGHVRFIKNMLAGVGAVDVAMLVVAANEGWMPQTAEHVAILELLDIRSGLVALTKADLVDAETLELAHLELAEQLERSPLAEWPTVAVDAITGRGLDELRAVLAAVVSAAPPPRDDGRARLWIDRVFAARGTGTVVTGTLTGGALTVDQDVVVEPGHRRARIRRIECHNARLERVDSGNRVALNLAGVDHDEIARGHAVVVAGQWVTPVVVDVAVRVLPGRELARRGEVHVHVGSGEHVASARAIDAEGTAMRLHFANGLPLAPGDRMILRSSARRETVGGASVLDVAPAPRLAEARTRLGLPLGRRVLAARPWSTPDRLAPLSGVADGFAFARALVAEGHAVTLGPWLVATERLTAVRQTAVDELHAPEADPHGVDLAVVAAACGVDTAQLRAALADDPRVTVDGHLVRDAAHTPVSDDPAARELLAALSAKPFDPPAPADLGAPASLVRALVRSGDLVDLDGVVLTRAAYDTARDRVSDAVVERGALTVADVRDLLGSTRKYVLPLLTRFDAEGITRRRGDRRIPGPRVLDVSRAEGADGARPR